MNRWIALSTIAFATLAAVSAARAEEKLEIGVSVPLTGNAAAYGTDIRNALVFANQKLFHDQYQLIIEDDQCSDKAAVSAAQKFINVDNVKSVLGFGCSGTVLAAALCLQRHCVWGGTVLAAALCLQRHCACSGTVFGAAPVYEKAKVPIIASVTGAPAISDAGDYIFRTKLSLFLAADLLAIETAGKFEKVGVISKETAYAQGLMAAYTKAASALGLEVLNENFLTGSEDFRATLLKLKQKGVQALFFNPQAEPGTVFL